MVTPDSPTLRVGGTALDKFTKVKHSVRMLSLTDAFSKDEVIAWEERLRRLEPQASWSYMAELKFDGLATTLVYEDGIFVLGATLGDGYIGAVASNAVFFSSGKHLMAAPIQSGGEP